MINFPLTQVSRTKAESMPRLFLAVKQKEYALLEELEARCRRYITPPGHCTPTPISSPGQAFIETDGAGAYQRPYIDSLDSSLAIKPSKNFVNWPLQQQFAQHPFYQEFAGRTLLFVAIDHYDSQTFTALLELFSCFPFVKENDLTPAEVLINSRHWQALGEFVEQYDENPYLITDDNFADQTPDVLLKSWIIKKGITGKDILNLTLSTEESKHQVLRDMVADSAWNLLSYLFEQAYDLPWEALNCDQLPVALAERVRTLQQYLTENMQADDNLLESKDAITSNLYKADKLSQNRLVSAVKNSNQTLISAMLLKEANHSPEQALIISLGCLQLALKAGQNALFFWLLQAHIKRLCSDEMDKQASRAHRDYHRVSFQDIMASKMENLFDQVLLTGQVDMIKEFLIRYGNPKSCSATHEFLTQPNLSEPSRSITLLISLIKRTIDTMEPNSPAASLVWQQFIQTCSIDTRIVGAMTALQYAANNQKEAWVAFLIAQGASVTLKTSSHVGIHHYQLTSTDCVSKTTDLRYAVNLLSQQSQSGDQQKSIKQIRMIKRLYQATDVCIDEHRGHQEAFYLKDYNTKGLLSCYIRQTKVAINRLFDEETRNQQTTLLDAISNPDVIEIDYSTHDVNQLKSQPILNIAALLGHRQLFTHLFERLTPIQYNDIDIALLCRLSLMAHQHEIFEYLLSQWPVKFVQQMQQEYNSLRNDKGKTHPIVLLEDAYYSENSQAALAVINRYGMLYKPIYMVGLKEPTCKLLTEIHAKHADLLNMIASSKIQSVALFEQQLKAYLTDCDKLGIVNGLDLAHFQEADYGRTLVAACLANGKVEYLQKLKACGASIRVGSKLISLRDRHPLDEIKPDNHYPYDEMLAELIDTEQGVKSVIRANNISILMNECAKSNSTRALNLLLKIGASYDEVTVSNIAEPTASLLKACKALDLMQPEAKCFALACDYPGNNLVDSFKAFITEKISRGAPINLHSDQDNLLQTAQLEERATLKYGWLSAILQHPEAASITQSTNDRNELTACINQADMKLLSAFMVRTMSRNAPVEQPFNLIQYTIDHLTLSDVQKVEIIKSLIFWGVTLEGASENDPMLDPYIKFRDAYHPDTPEPSKAAWCAQSTVQDEQTSYIRALIKAKQFGFINRMITNEKPIIPINRYARKDGEGLSGLDQLMIELSNRPSLMQNKDFVAITSTLFNAKGISLATILDKPLKLPDNSTMSLGEFIRQKTVYPLNLKFVLAANIPLDSLDAPHPTVAAFNYLEKVIKGEMNWQHIPEQWRGENLAVTLQVLLEFTDKRTHSQQGHSFVHMAIESNNMDCLQVLCEQGLDIKGKTAGLTPVNVAVQLNHLQALRILLQHDAPLTKQPFETQLAKHCNRLMDIIDAPLPEPAPEVEGEAILPEPNHEPSENGTTPKIRQWTKAMRALGTSNFMVEHQYFTMSYFEFLIRSKQITLIKAAISEGVTPWYKPSREFLIPFDGDSDQVSFSIEALLLALKEEQDLNLEKCLVLFRDLYTYKQSSSMAADDDIQINTVTSKLSQNILQKLLETIILNYLLNHSGFKLTDEMQEYIVSFPQRDHLLLDHHQAKDNGNYEVFIDTYSERLTTLVATFENDEAFHGKGLSDYIHLTLGQIAYALGDNENALSLFNEIEECQHHARVEEAKLIAKLGIKPEDKARHQNAMERLGDLLNTAPNMMADSNTAHFRAPVLRSAIDSMTPLDLTNEEVGVNAKTILCLAELAYQQGQTIKKLMAQNAKPASTNEETEKQSEDSKPSFSGP